MMRFRKRVKVFPGFHLNFSTSGISSAPGFNGASVNFGKRKLHSGTEIPAPGEPQPIDRDRTSRRPFKGIAEEYKSAALNELDSTNLGELKELLNEVYNDRTELSKEIGAVQISLSMSEIIHILSRVLLIGFFIKFFRHTRDEKRDYLLDLEQQLENAYVDIDLHFDDTFQNKYQAVTESYKELLSARVIWDITSSVQQDKIAARSAASHVVNRIPVVFRMDSINIIRSSCKALHFENKNGGDLYIYPGFVIMTNNMKAFAMLDLKNLEIVLSPQRFIEREKVPADTVVIGKTWAKVNKNGTPDKRFKYNYEIPIVRYAQLDVRSASGLNEVYMVSNYDMAERFVQALYDYQRLLRTGNTSLNAN